MRSLLLLPLLLLTACAGLDTPDVPPDNRYTIDVVRQPDGSFKAMAPACMEWSEDHVSRTNNDAFPQLGCTTRGNLAKQIAYPEDLVRDQWATQPPYPGADGTTLATGVQRYQENRTYVPESNLTSASE
jgi:hypothetical protein